MIDDLLMHQMDLAVGQSSFIAAIEDFIRQALLAFRNRVATILVKDFNSFNQALAKFVDATDDLLSWNGVINDQRKITLNSRITRQGISLYLPRRILKQVFKVKFESHK